MGEDCLKCGWYKAQKGETNMSEPPRMEIWFGRRTRISDQAHSLKSLPVNTRSSASYRQYEEDRERFRFVTNTGEHAVWNLGGAGNDITGKA